MFAPHASLGGSLDAQSAVVLNSAGTEYIALNNGIVQRWDLSGTALPSVTLSGWGTVGSETSYPANRGLASLGGYWLTYTAGILSAWNATTGDRVDTTVLNGAGQTFDSYFSFSDANDMAFVADDSPSSLGLWRGYLIDLQDLAGDPGLPRVPDGGSTLVLLGVAVIGLAAVRYHGIA